MFLASPISSYMENIWRNQMAEALITQVIAYNFPSRKINSRDRTMHAYHFTLRLKSYCIFIEFQL